jgi:hypothetical protein
LSTLDGTRIHSLTASFSRWGSWRVQAVLEAGVPPAEGTMVDIDIAGLEALGAVGPAGLDRPERPHVVVVGGAGWDAPVSTPPKLSWFSDGGVRLRTVLTALSAAAGEPVELPTDRTLANHYVTAAGRPGAPARYRNALAALVREGAIPGWWVGPDGITRFVPRPEGDVAARATAMPARRDVGLRVFGVDSPATFLPGRSVEGIVIERLVVVQTPNTLVVECWSP